MKYQTSDEYAKAVQAQLERQGLDADIVEFVSEVERRRFQRGSPPMPLDRFPAKQAATEAGECLKVAEEMILRQQEALVSSASAMVENKKLKAKLDALEAEKRPSAVAKAPAAVTTYYWDPYNAGDGDY